MRILFCHENFPGRFGHLATQLAADPAHEVLFASCFQRHGVSLPGVRRVILRADRTRRAAQAQTYAAQWQQAVAAGEGFFNMLQKLAAQFQPHMVLTIASGGRTFFVRQAFAGAFHVFYCGDTLSLSAQTAPCHAASNAMQALQALQSHACFCFDAAQRALFPPQVQAHVRVIPPWVDTDMMHTAQAGPFQAEGFDYTAGQELVSLDLKYLSPQKEQAVSVLLRCLLRERPQTRLVLNLSRGTGRAGLRAWCDRLPEAMRRRLCIADALRLEDLRDMLCAARLHICPEPATPLLYRLEAMSCGTALLAPAVQPFFRPGKNMLALPENTEDQCRAMLAALENPQHCAQLGRTARQDVLATYSQQKLVPSHADCLLAAYARHSA